MLNYLGLRDLLMLPSARSMPVVVRSIRPADEAKLTAFFRGLSPQSRNRRFLAVMNEVPATLIAHFVRPDTRNEVALVATTGDGATETVIGEARFVADHGQPNFAEFAIVVADVAQGSGVGERLLRALVRRAHVARVDRLYGDVLPENRAMLRLARKLGFIEGRDPLDPRLVRVHRTLHATLTI
jgi:acetyltransferase